MKIINIYIVSLLVYEDEAEVARKVGANLTDVEIIDYKKIEDGITKAFEKQLILK